MFHVLPGNFFVPLASPNKTVYWECICKLFSVMDYQLSFGIEREVVADELQYYFEQSAAAEIVEEDFAGADSRGKANGILRKLEHYGWIEIETDKSYVQRVNFKEYAVRVMKTLLEIEDGKQIEYQGYIYTIYSLVRGNTDNPGVVLLQIMENTDLLITGLKNLNSNIKHYIDELTKHSTVAEIMDALFNDYITNIVDKAYHRLLTSDNVSKFRPEIIERLESRSKSRSYIEKAASELAGLQETDVDTARENVYRYLHEIIEAFRNMDDILNEINQKNTQYQRAAINRARFLLSGNEDIRGQLKELLLGINEVMNEEKMELGGIYEIGFLDNLVRIYSCGFLDESSLYSPIEGKKTFEPQQIINREPDSRLRQEKMRRMVEKMQKILSAEKIGRYVDECMGERKEMLATELPLSDAEDFVKIIYVRLYGQRKNMRYGVETGEEKEVNGFRFRDFRIWRK
ncbi:MAG TPA: hypothetical protein IAA44_08385 [Candidatus Blautia avistercoris]|uniref:Wadjet anti-phage system protein JetA family protein n=1 Tax=Blautia sp. An249 TaxID=1965603 RepID=UPI000B3958C7|nr:Wadjet anti-phage system protein JetA family protein [Blautia sp. An249]OUO79645.1 hypothetical protein B5F53_06740 [Blautia sp. An249]HIY19405.1 hypothetical protein [Candidatus Blautia avistercoris]